MSSGFTHSDMYKYGMKKCSIYSSVYYIQKN